MILFAWFIEWVAAGFYIFTVLCTFFCLDVWDFFLWWSTATVTLLRPSLVAQLTHILHSDFSVGYTCTLRLQLDFSYACSYHFSNTLSFTLF